MNVRMIRLRPRTVATSLAVMAGGLVAGCGDDDDVAKEAAAKPTAFAVTATAEGKKKALEFPATVKAGLVTVTLTNSDKAPRSAQLLRVDEAHTVDDVLKIVEAETDGFEIPSWMQEGGGLGTTAPGASASATQVLTPGKWVI